MDKQEIQIPENNDTIEEKESIELEKIEINNLGIAN